MAPVVLFTCMQNTYTRSSNEMQNSIGCCSQRLISSPSTEGEIEDENVGNLYSSHQTPAFQTSTLQFSDFQTPPLRTSVVVADDLVSYGHAPSCVSVVECPFGRTMRRIEETTDRMVECTTWAKDVTEIRSIIQNVQVKEEIPHFVEKKYTPEFRTIQVVKNVNRLVPIPIAVRETLQLKLPQIVTVHEKIKYPVYVPRFVEVGIPSDKLTDKFRKHCNDICQEVANLIKTAQSSTVCLSQIESTGIRVKKWESVVDEAIVKGKANQISRLTKDWDNGNLRLQSISASSTQASDELTPDYGCLEKDDDHNSSRDPIAPEFDPTHSQAAMDEIENDVPSSVHSMGQSIRRISDLSIDNSVSTTTEQLTLHGCLDGSDSCSKNPMSVSEQGACFIEDQEQPPRLERQRSSSTDDMRPSISDIPRSNSSSPASSLHSVESSERVLSQMSDVPTDATHKCPSLSLDF